MSEYDDETLVRDSFALFRTRALAQAPQPDRVEVGAIARRRRRVQVELLAVVVALALVVPAAVLAATAHRGGAKPAPLGTGSPSVSASASPAPSPSVPSSAPTLTPISFDELSRSGVDVPAWPAGTPNGCPSGHFRFSGATTTVSGSLVVRIVDALQVDVDHNGSAETAALLSCESQGAGTQQVVVFGRTPAGGIVTVGPVAGSGSGTVRGIAAIRAESGGAVGVQVADVGSMQRPDWLRLAQLQWRTYSWNGHAFTQTAGPRTFPVNPRIADLGVSASDLTLNAGGDGAHHGTLTVTVRNSGPGSPATAQLDLYTGDSMDVTPPAGVTCTVTGVPPAFENNSCTFAPPAAGRTATLVFEYKTVGSVVFTPGDPLPPGKATVSGPYDPKPADNQATFQVSTAS